MRTPIPILLYHRVSHRGGPFITPPPVFAQHLDWLAERGYRSLTATELGEVLSGDRPPPSEPAVAITFDDGYADLPTEVAPMLRDRGLRGTAFLITANCPDQPEEGHENVAWSDVRALAGDGVLEFQSHTHTHTRWDLEPALAATVVDDIAASRAMLSSRLGEPERAFTHVAWPWGRTCPEWEEGAARLGVPSQYVVQRGAVTRLGQHHRLPRILLDGAPVGVMARWMGVLSNRVGATATNQVFGAVRQWRQGPGYR